MSKPDLIISMSFELISKAKSKVIIYSFAMTVIIQKKLSILQGLWRIQRVLVTGNRILFVGDILATSKPSFILLTVKVPRPYARFHSFLVETCCFGQIKDVKLNFMNFFILMHWNSLADNFKIVPLSMTSCVQIIFQPQIVFNVTDLCNFSQICIFKP